MQMQMQMRMQMYLDADAVSRYTLHITPHLTLQHKYSVWSSRLGIGVYINLTYSIAPKILWSSVP